jgi:hypothetical protein
MAGKAMFVDRMTEHTANAAGGSVTDQIHRRFHEDPDNTVFCMFPEGTTTNGTHLIHFRTGAFVPGVPVAPIIFKFPYCFMDPSGSSCPPLTSLIYNSSQLCNWMTVEYLPMYFPSDAEKADPKLYAANVKALMIEKSGLIPSEKTYNDKFEWEQSVGYVSGDAKKQLRAKKKRELDTIKRSKSPKISPSAVELLETQASDQAKKELSMDEDMNRIVSFGSG